MSSQAQINANRLNSQLSTGPKSEAGKTKISQNARKHGLAAKYVACSPEEQPDFDLLETTLFASIKPNGPLQMIHFREIVSASWKIEAINKRLTTSFPSADATLDPANDAEFRRLERYRNEATRAIARATKALQLLQTQEQIHDAHLMFLQQAHPNVPEELLKPPIFLNLAKAFQDGKALPHESKPTAASNLDPENLAFLQLINQMAPGALPKR